MENKDMTKKVLNNAENYEHLATVKLDKEKWPVAYGKKKYELMSECGMTESEAEQMIADMEIELEIYYEPGSGLFAVEAEAVEAGTIYSPYSGELYEPAEED